MPRDHPMTRPCWFVLLSKSFFFLCGRGPHESGSTCARLFVAQILRGWAGARVTRTRRRAEAGWHDEDADALALRGER